MENVFVGQEILKKYDLKGCTFLRKNPAECTTLLDQNLVDDMSNRLVNYSLLIGLRRVNGKHQLLTGTIDYLQPFTWKKKVEFAFKSFRSCWNCMEEMGYEYPTVCPPDLYAARFMRSMRRYFGLNGECGPSPSQE
ncbi:hypothetical protein LUZ60_003325 [Juncus effusus]|nr:hypothetical protein LUZ60_003325 [Juncus effusus]